MPIRHSREPVAPDVERIGREVLDAAFRVHSALGPSLREGFYERCMAHTLRQRDLLVDANAAIDVAFEGLTLPRALRHP